MAKIEIQETTLPGVGVRHEFSIDDGERIGVITHHSGQRDVLVYDKVDPDICRISVRMTEREAGQLGQLLGASQVTQTFANLSQTVAGLTIDWIPIRSDWECAGHSISEVNFTAVGVLIVAVIRNEQTIPTPKANFQLWSGDTVVVIGKPEGIQQVYNDLHG